MKTPRLWGKKSVGPYLYVILYVITNGKDGVNGVNGVGFKTFSGKKIINSYYIVDNNYLFFSEKVWIALSCETRLNVDNTGVSDKIESIHWK